MANRFRAITGCCILALAILFPPWEIEYASGLRESIGFHFLFTPPQVTNAHAVIEAGKFVLILMLVAVLLLSLIWYGWKQEVAKSHLSNHSHSLQPSSQQSNESFEPNIEPLLNEDLWKR